MLSIGQHARYPRPFGSNCMLPGRLGGGLDLNVELVELRLVDGAGCAEHQVLMALGLGESDDVADVLGAGEHHHDAIDSRRDPSVRRNTVLECIKQVTKALAPQPGEINAVGVNLTAFTHPNVFANVEDRRLADFSESEITDLLRQEGFGSLASAPAGAA